MHLSRLKLMNFQSFGAAPTTLELGDLTFLLGPNGAGKTAVLTALARMFAIDPGLRRIQRSDFHVPPSGLTADQLENQTLWIEADFVSDQPEEDGTTSSTIPSFFNHMRISAPDELPRVRVRLSASTDDVGDVEEKIVFVTEVDGHDEPIASASMDRYDRRAIQVHYLPARRDPRRHIAYTSNTLLGRLLRAVDWSAEESVIESLTTEVSESLSSNDAITKLDGLLDGIWKDLHAGEFFNTPSITFTSSDVDALLRHLNIAFDSAPGDEPVLDWTRLSDGQQSLLYLTLVLALQALGAKVIVGDVPMVDAAKLKPASFTMIAVEEPENSLSPHYLGRVIRRLHSFAREENAQAILSTHSPSVVRRVAPESIRYLRLGEERRTVVSRIVMPPESEEAYKFVREAVVSFPELYFSRVVILGEGDSEQVVVPRLLEAGGIVADLTSVSVVPLGGRHVNHFWRLLDSLAIPFLTLLDLDLARHQGGWGRVKYAMKQLRKYPANNPAASKLQQEHIDQLPEWDDAARLLLQDDLGDRVIKFLEKCGVYFSSPLDLDFAMVSAYADAYGLQARKLVQPSAEILSAVLGQGRALDEQYSDDELKRFAEYQRIFKTGSKPVQHLSALSELADAELRANMPSSLARMVEHAKATLEKLPP